MKLYSFEVHQQRKIGAEWEGQIIDLAVSYRAMTEALGPKQGALRVLPADMPSFIRLGPLALDAALETINYLKRRPAVPVGDQLVYPFDAVKILPPVSRPGKILCAEFNFPDPKATSAGGAPGQPFFFAKMPSTIIGPGESVIKPRLTSQLDFEVELAVVIGKKMKAAEEGSVMDFIFGYTIVNDISARDIQLKDNQITLSKNCDTFCPLGPCLVTADEIGNPANLRLRTELNGQEMQNGSTADWIFPLPRLLSVLSQVMTLEPGDIISTGTPSGTGASRNPPVFMKPGDIVRVEVEGVGWMENKVAAEV